MVLTELQKGALGVAGLLGFLGLLSIKAKVEECIEGNIEYSVCIDPVTGQTERVVQPARMMPPANSIAMRECRGGVWVDLDIPIPISWCWRPPECTVEGETKCVGMDLYKCVNGEWVLWEHNNLVCGEKICAGKYCPIICVNNDMYKPKCDPAIGECVPDEILSKNSFECGYIPPEAAEGICEQVPNMTCGSAGRPAREIFDIIERCGDDTLKKWTECKNYVDGTGKLYNCSRECAPEICVEGEVEILAYCSDGRPAEWRKCVRWLPNLPTEWNIESQICPGGPCYNMGDVRVQEWCPDGITPKRWFTCEAGTWVEYYGICPAPECEEGAEQVLEYCRDGITFKRLLKCVGGKWREYFRYCTVPLLAGLIIDRNGYGIVGAKVELRYESNGPVIASYITSLDTGYYAFSGFTGGMCYVTASKAGYITKTVSANITAGSYEGNFNIVLEVT